MQLVSYRPRAGTDEFWRAGVEHAGLVVDVAPLWHGNSHEVTTRQLLADGSATIESVIKQTHEILATGSEASGVLQVTSIDLGPPIPDPDKIICIGLNYADHANEAGLAQTQVPLFFAKFRNSLIGPTSTILLPRASNQIDYEGELAVIIGTRCKEVSEQEALQYVAGYSIMNDVSARDLQMQTSQYIAGKALDTFAPMGPGIVLASAIPNPQDLLLTTNSHQRLIGFQFDNERRQTTGCSNRYHPFYHAANYAVIHRLNDLPVMVQKTICNSGQTSLCVLRTIDQWFALGVAAGNHQWCSAHIS